MDAVHVNSCIDKVVEGLVDEVLVLPGEERAGKSIRSPADVTDKREKTHALDLTLKLSSGNSSAGRPVMFSTSLTSASPLRKLSGLLTTLGKPFGRWAFTQATLALGRRTDDGRRISRLGRGGADSGTP